MFRRWKKYDPTWLIRASAYRFHEYPWLEVALTQCIRAKERNDWYTYFVNGSRPNKAGSEWQFQESITIENTPNGDIVIDVVRSNRVGGVEFLSRVMGESTTS